MRVNRAESLDAVVAALAPPGSRPTTMGRVARIYSVIVGDPPGTRGPRKLSHGFANITSVGPSKRLSEITRYLAADLALFVAHHCPHRVFVHSGVVEYRGRAILLPGPSFVGKSELVAALVAAGARYYSDEFAVIDDRGRVHPFAKPIMLRTGSTGDEYHAPEHFGSVGRRSVPVGAVVVTRFRPGARFRPKHATPAHGAMALLRNAIAITARPTRTTSSIGRAVAGTQVVIGDRGEAGAAAPAILGLLETP